MAQSVCVIHVEWALPRISKGLASFARVRSTQLHFGAAEGFPPFAAHRGSVVQTEGPRCHTKLGCERVRSIHNASMYRVIEWTRRADIYVERGWKANVKMRW